jgi:hypothetical protein
MYRLRKDVDLSFLFGAQLLQVCVGKNELMLNFDRDVRVTILSDIVVTPPRGAPVTYRDTAGGATALLPLLHDSITGATATDAGGLQLSFQTGATVELLDTSSQFESFWLSDGDHKIVV